MVLNLFVLFAVMPIIEIYILMTVGSALGAPTTIALVIITAAVGASLVRSQGLSTLMSVQQRMNRGEIPGQQIVEGMLLAIAGVLLVTPGFVTDFLGLLILTPATRAPIAKSLLKRMQVKQMGQGGFHAHFGQHSNTFDHQDPFQQQNPFQQDELFQDPRHGQDKPNERPKGGHTIDGDYERKD